MIKKKSLPTNKWQAFLVKRSRLLDVYNIFSQILDSFFILIFIICQPVRINRRFDSMTPRKLELVTPQTIEKGYRNYMWRMRSESLGMMFLLKEAKEYGAQPETIALIEKSIKNFERICEIEFPGKEKGGN
jgi:hypothetical protein